MRLFSSAINVAPLCSQLDNVAKCYIPTPFEHFQRWQFHHFPGHSIPLPAHTFSGEFSPNIQPHTPLAQLEAISCPPVTCCLGGETELLLTKTSFQVDAEGDGVPPYLHFLQAKHSQLPHLLHTRLVLRTLLQFCHPSLDTLQQINVFLVVRDSEMDKELKMWPQK